MRNLAITIIDVDEISNSLVSVNETIVILGSWIRIDI